MATTLETIVAALAGFGYPIAKTEFKDTKQNPAPAPPFIIWFATEQIRDADIPSGTKRTVVCEINGSIELYTDIADAAKNERVQIAKRIKAEALLGVDFTEFEAPIQSENMYQNAFEFKIVEKRKNGL